MSTPEPINTTQKRGYAVFRSLFGHENTGISCQQLADLLGYDKAVIYRDLQTLKVVGFAEQLPNKRWRVAPSFGREAFKIVHSVQEARRRLDETAERYGLNDLPATSTTQWVQ